MAPFWLFQASFTDDEVIPDAVTVGAPGAGVEGGGGVQLVTSLPRQMALVVLSLYVLTAQPFENDEYSIIVGGGLGIVVPAVVVEVANVRSLVD